VRRIGRAVGLAVCTIELYTTSVRSLNVSEFREQCLALLEQLPAEGIVVTNAAYRSPGSCPFGRTTPI
jgi:hypothetical protein